jgi:hypothetical protein
MQAKFILTISAIYLGLVGLALLLVPAYAFLGLASDVSSLIIAQLRAFSDVFIGIAVLNWLARNAEASKARDAIFIGNSVGFTMSVILGVNVSLNSTQEISWIFTILSLFCAIGFIVQCRTNLSTRSGTNPVK